MQCGFIKEQELSDAVAGSIYMTQEQEDPIEFFGIDPKEYVDVDELVQKYMEDFNSYQNE